MAVETMRRGSRMLVDEQRGAEREEQGLGWEAQTETTRHPDIIQPNQT